MFADVNGTRLNYVEQGSGPDLLLLPGLGASTHVWYAQVKALSATMRVIAVDPRGHGESAIPPPPYSLSDMAADAAHLLRHLCQAPALVVGSSMSSLAAVELAAKHPELVSGLVLAGGFATLSCVYRERMEERARIVESEGMGALVEKVGATALGATTHATQPALVGLFQALLLRNNPDAYAACCRAIASADVTPLLADVRCPTLILLGEEEQVAPWPAARVVAQGIPHAVVRVIPKAGHLAFLEQPAAFNAALLEFVTANRAG